MIENYRALYNTLGKVSPLGRESVQNLEKAFQFLEQLMIEEQNKIQKELEKNSGE